MEKYAAAYTAAGITFLPFVLTTHGAVGLDALEFLDEMAALKVERGDGPPLASPGAAHAAVRDRMDQLLSVALMASVARRIIFAMAVGGTRATSDPGIDEFLGPESDHYDSVDFEPFDHDDAQGL